MSDGIGAGGFTPSMANPGNPLRRFRGVLKDWQARTFTPEGGRPRVTIDFNFIDLEVIDSVEPYPYPITTVSIGYSDPSQTSNTNTRWATLSESARKLTVGLCPPEETLNFLAGKRQEWAMQDAEINQPDEEGNWKLQSVPCWKIVELEGGVEAESGGDILDYVAGLLDGKDESSFYASLFSDGKVKAHSTIIQQATDRELIPVLEAGGYIQRDPSNSELWVRKEKAVSG